MRICPSLHQYQLNNDTSIRNQLTVLGTVLNIANGHDRIGTLSKILCKANVEKCGHPIAVFLHKN